MWSGSRTRRAGSIRRAVVRLALVGLLAVGSPAIGVCSVAAVPAAAPKTILVLGDSLSAAHNIATQSGWVHLLEVRLTKMKPGWAVVNASVSGETSLSGRHRLSALLAKYRPAVLVLELGANDGLRGLPLPALRDNLAAMIDQAREAGTRVLLVGIELPLNYGPQYRDGLRAVYAGLAKDRRIALVPFLLEGVALDPTRMQDDGLHPTAEGEPAVLETVWAGLWPLLR